MLWILMLFAVGICGAIGFYDRILDFSDTMRYFNSGILVLLSMGLLVRTWMLTKYGKNEKLQSRKDELERMLGQSGRGASDREKQTVSRQY